LLYIKIKINSVILIIAVDGELREPRVEHVRKYGSEMERCIQTVWVDGKSGGFGDCFWVLNKNREV